jgi:DNA-binding response OmpR family regulator
MAGHDEVEHQGVRIDLYRHRAFIDGRELSLTPTEFRLLEHLVPRPGRVFTREQLAGVARTRQGVKDLRTIDHHVAALRAKLGSASLIETVHAVGYRFGNGPGR